MNTGRYVDMRNDLLADVFRKRDRGEWLRLLKQAGVPHAPVHNIDEVLEDAEIKTSKSFYCVTHPQRGDVLCIHRPVLYDGRRELETYPPILGAHTKEIIAGVKPIKKQFKRLVRSRRQIRR